MYLGILCKSPNEPEMWHDLGVCAALICTRRSIFTKRINPLKKTSGTRSWRVETESHIWRSELPTKGKFSNLKVLWRYKATLRKESTWLGCRSETRGDLLCWARLNWNAAELSSGIRMCIGDLEGNSLFCTTHHQCFTTTGRASVARRTKLLSPQI